VAVTAVHGLIHLLGVAKGWDLASVEALQQPVSSAMGAVWLAASLLLVVTAVLLALRVRWWWVVGAIGLVVSQVAIVSSWSDALAGTAANVVLALAVGYGFAADGPFGLRAEYRRRAARIGRTSEAGAAPTVVAEADLTRLPDLVAGYVRRSGAVGRPPLLGFRARIHGRIRSAPDKPWMSFTGEQVNRYGSAWSRLFIMDATMGGLPVDVLHVCVGDEATMRVKVCSLITMADASGPDMDQAETVTLFNDLCVLAPGAIPGAPIVWQASDDSHRATGTLRIGDHSATATLVFDDDGDLFDFVSDDRLRSSSDGDTFVRQRWSTPVSAHRELSGRRLATVGEGRWHAPDPEGEFTYLEFVADDVEWHDR
jgi:hypothetical protein